MKCEVRRAVNLLTAVNEAYLDPLAVMLYSFIRWNKTELNIYILHFEISPERQRQFRAQFRKRGNGRVNIYFLKAEKEIFSGIAEDQRYKYETNLRLLMLKMLPQETDRILWLDVDIIVKGNLRRLYEYPDKGQCAVVCDDMFPKSERSYVLKKSGMCHGDRYFNAGVMLLYLNNIRKMFREDDFTGWMHDNPEKLIYQDQSVLNNCFKHRLVWANAGIYNLQLLRVWELPDERRRLRRARIVHYNTKDKPWSSAYQGIGELLYWRYGIMILGIGKCIGHFAGRCV